MSIPRYLIVLAALSLPVPAYAAGGSVQLPEPSGMVLLALGFAGVAVGRRFSSKRPRD